MPGRRTWRADAESTTSNEEEADDLRDEGKQSNIARPAKLDGEKGASVINRFLAAVPGLSRRKIYERIGNVYHLLLEKSVPVVHKGLWRILEQVEWQEAAKRGLEEFKFGTNDEMLRNIEERIIKRS
ncbi:MAG: hypothetical protein IH782_04240 [candidate division NC10 bacterium]|nr:hypothetical protein [candidate division NC10 bacterium]